MDQSVEALQADRWFGTTVSSRKSKSFKAELTISGFSSAYFKGGMKKMISILEYSACGNKQSAQKLRFKGNQDERCLAVLQIMLRKQPYDLISVRDLPYRALKHLEPTLLAMGYNMYIDPTWKSVTEKCRYSSLSVLFVKNDIKFTQIAGYFGFETVLRYVCGIFKFNGRDIIYRTSHIPGVDDTRSQLSRQIQRKENMLAAEIEYQNEHIDDCAISSGDYNGGIEEDCYCHELFKDFTFTDLISGPTYEKHQLDHVFISDGFKKSGISVEAEIIDDYYMEFTDHRMISIKLKAS